MPINDLLKYIVTDDNFKATDEFENLMADKVGMLVDTRKREVANVLFNSDDDVDDSDDIVEEDIDLLRDIVDSKKDQKYKFSDGSTMDVDVQTASLLLIVYESLDESNKKKFEEKVYKSKKSFLELVTFAQKKIG